VLCINRWIYHLR